MALCETLWRRRWRGPARLAGALAAVVALAALAGTPADGQQGKIDVLHIGTSGSLNGEKVDAKEKAALKTLKAFIKEETGLENDITDQNGWEELTDKLAQGKLHLGVYQGYEFAWAQEKHPELKALALAVNVHRYPSAYIMASPKVAARDFKGLQGKTLAIPTDGPRFLRFYAERQAQAAGKKLDEFFGKVTTPARLVTAIDDVVDGTVDAVVVDRAALEEYKQLKPARFKKLQPVAHSPPLPPALVAYYGKHLDKATRDTFHKGLLDASKKEKGKQTLELFGLTHFETTPSDFGKVLADTRKAYPAPPKK
jgi:ABC-type phosphate/phosphonate transport system substrate-binding protein